MPELLQYLLLCTALTIEHPDLYPAAAHRFHPPYTDPADVQLESPSVVIATHASSLFDPLGVTRQAVIRTVGLADRDGVPVLYLHDKYNERNSLLRYHYANWNPTAYVSSDVGNFDVDFSGVRQAVLLGGYAGQCQRSTLSDVLRLWRRDNPESDLEVLMVTDGIFDVTEHVRFEDPYYDAVKAWKQETAKSVSPTASVSLNGMLQHVTDEQALTLLRRYLPPLPSGCTVTLQFRTSQQQIRSSVYSSATAPQRTVLIRYITTDDIECGLTPFVGRLLPSAGPEATTATESPGD